MTNSIINYTALAEAAGIPANTLKSRMRRGLNLEEALTWKKNAHKGKRRANKPRRKPEPVQGELFRKTPRSPYPSPKEREDAKQQVRRENPQGQKIQKRDPDIQGLTTQEKLDAQLKETLRLSELLIEQVKQNQRIMQSLNDAHSGREDVRRARDADTVYYDKKVLDLHNEVVDLHNEIVRLEAEAKAVKATPPRKPWLWR